MATVTKLLLPAVMVALVFAVLVQTAVLVKKCFDGKTTVARAKSVTHHTLAFPDISFCPGFRVGSPDWISWSWSNETVEDFQVEKREELDAVWIDSVFRAEEVLEVVSGLYVNEEEEEVNHEQIDLWKEGSHDNSNTIVTHDTLSGKCHTITFVRPLARRDYIRIFLKLKDTYHNRIVVYFHPPGSELGLNENFWPGSAMTLNLHGGTVEDIGLTKTVRLKKYGVGSEEEFFKCIRQDVSRYMNGLAGNDSGMCYFPSFKSLTSFMADPDALPHCRNSTELARARILVYQALYNHVFETPCPLPESRSSYHAAQKQQLKAMKTGTTKIAIFYDTHAVGMEEEYVLFDFADFISSVGGIFGVFLGWSLLGLARFMTSPCKTIKTIYA